MDESDQSDGEPTSGASKAIMAFIAERETAYIEKVLDAMVNVGPDIVEGTMGTMQAVKSHEGVDMDLVVTVMSSLVITLFGFLALNMTPEERREAWNGMMVQIRNCNFGTVGEMTEVSEVPE